MGTRPGEAEDGISRRKFLSQAGLAIAGSAAAITAEALVPLGQSSAASAAAPQAGQPQRGGTLTISQSVDINTLHPWTGTLNVWKVTKTNIYDQLSYQDPTTFQVRPKLARSFVWTDNNTSLVVALPSGVTFHNGEKLTAEDVKFTLDSIRDPKVGSWLRGFLAPIKDVQVLDATHLKIKTETIENQLIPAFTYVDIVPRSMGTDLSKKNPIGSGPYKFAEWVPNDHVTLERNPNYWNEAHAGHVDKIVFRPVTELQTRIAQLLAGDVDMVYDFSLQEVPRLRADKSVVVAVVPPADQMFVVYLNMRKPPFNKLQMRQAMGWALDRQGFVKNFLAGLGRPDNSPFTPQHWAFDPKTETAYAYNPDNVAKLVEEAGYPKGRGLSFSFLVPSGYPEFKQLSTMVQATFASIGYRPAIEEVDIAQWAARLNQTRDFFAAVDYPPRGSTDPALTYSAGLLFPPNPANVCGLTPEMIPGYLDEIRKGATTLDRGARKAAYFNVQEMWLESLPGPIYCHRATAHAHLPSVNGFVPHPAFQQSFADVWIAR
ncbi:MAG TPA: ABC transporter substrate-binding protein [bacterium]|nr:ABC transporter substrate-binding protein [bacterium]